MTYEEISNRIIEWAEDRDIFTKSNALAQLSKTQEELEETREALLSGSEYEVSDGIGDMLVTIIILAEMVEMNSTECLRQAYKEIRDRKGKMVDGLFVKEN